MKKILNLLLIFLAISFYSGQSKKEIRRQGLAAFNSEDYTEAKEKYLQLLAKGEKTWENYTILGDCELSTGNAEEALVYFTKGLEKNPIYPGLYFRIATVLSQQKKYDEAIDNFRRMLIGHPGNPQVYNMIASAYYQKGDYEAALNELNTMVNLGGENLDSSYGRSVSYIKLNQITEACVELEKADQFDVGNENREIDVLKAQFCSK